MKKNFTVLAFLFAMIASAQKVTVTGRAVDSSKGLNAIEVVINDTLSRLMKDPKANRSKYLRMYQDERYVVRTDSTGAFSIRADLNDTLYFKSYRHVPQARPVRELIGKEPLIRLIEEN